MNNRELAQKNIASGLLKLLVSIIMPFIIRTAMLYTLGKEYLGLNSLFTSILSVLNLAELGFSNAIIYSMYKPIAQGDNKKICALLSFYRKIYFAIGIIIFVCGIIITPFITYFINGLWPRDINIYILFLIYLINVCISYWFFAYKTALLNALKRVNIINFVQVFIYMLQYIIQLFILIFVKNYYCYIILTPISTIVINLVIARKASIEFPEYKCDGTIAESDKKMIINNVKGILLYRISETTRNSLDTIVISSFIGLGMVAIYNNYYYIFTAVYGILVTINQGTQAIIGNNLVVKSRENNYLDMNKYHTGIMCLVSWFSVCLICMYQPFMHLWVGDEMKLSNINVILLGLYFYVLNMNNIRNLYFDGKGLWLSGRWTFILEIAGNLILNIVLGKYFGVSGVILATIVTIFIFSGICRTHILYSSYFLCSTKAFWLITGKNVFITMLSLLCTYIVCQLVHIDNGILKIIYNMVVCLIIPNFVLYIFYRNNQMYKSILRQIKRRI